MFRTFRVLLATRKADAIALWHYAFFWKTFQPTQMQRHSPIIWAKPNKISFDIDTRFSLSTSPLQTRVMGFIFCATAIFTEICRCSSWRRCIFVQLFWLCSWNNCSYLQTKGWCMAATQGQLCKISECGFAKWLDYQPLRVMGKQKTWLCTMLYELGVLK